MNRGLRETVLSRFTLSSQKQQASGGAVCVCISGGFISDQSFPHALHVARPLKHCSLWRKAKSQSLAQFTHAPLAPSSSRSPPSHSCFFTLSLSPPYRPCERATGNPLSAVACSSPPLTPSLSPFLRGIRLLWSKKSVVRHDFIAPLPTYKLISPSPLPPLCHILVCFAALKALILCIPVVTCITGTMWTDASSHGQIEQKNSRTSCLMFLHLLS